MHDPAPLLRDLDRLDAALRSARVALGDDATPCDELERKAVAHRAAPTLEGRRAFATRVAELSDDALEDVARVYATWCQLMNTAEERQRLRTLHTRGAHPPDGVVAALASLGAAASDAELRALFDRALVMPVLTAHPTEARRRSSLEHLTRIGAALDRDGDAVTAEVLALYGTEDARARRPTPLDEVETILDVFRRSLLDVTPRIYRTIEDALRPRLGPSWRAPTFLRWGSWVGGDRDGNPNVTAHVTRSAFARHRALVLNRYLDDVSELGRVLSVSELRARLPFEAIDELREALERDRARLPETAAHAAPRTAHEPWREKLWYVQARLRATLEHRDDGYVDAEEYRDELALLDRTLRGAGFEQLAERELRDAIRRADVFGFHLASLDLRQHSGIHDRVVAEVLARGGRAGYLDLDEPARQQLLDEVLAKPLPPIRDSAGLSAEAQDVIATLEVAGRARRELGPRACERYVISFTRELSDLLEVVLLARCAGLAPGELRPVPLLEQLEDLERAGAIARDVLADPTLREELGDELEVMIGYSDSGKQVGYVASTVALRRAQLELVDATERSGVMLTLFHGRGGALGRGGGPAGDAIRAQPASAVRGRLRVTEQGETVTARYGHPGIAERDLELTLAAIFGAAASERMGTCDAADEPAVAAALDRAAAAARAVYRELTSDEDRLVRYTLAATPIDYVSQIPIGSRPASRKATLSLDALRAIPWVFSWTQSRHGIPGWFGIGTAIGVLARELGGDATRALVDGSRFVRALVHNGELSLVRSDIDVAREYARLADDDARVLFDRIADEHARALTALRDTLGHTSLLASRPYLVASVARRNPFIDILSHVQIEALQRRREGRGDPTQLARILFTTINGIAAGLQTAG